MYTYVAPISVFWDAFLRLTEQFLAVPDGYRVDDLGHFTAFQRTAFTCRFSLGKSSGFSVRAPRMSTKRALLVGPQGVLIRFRRPHEA